MQDNINFIDLTLDEKKMVLEWRNHPDVKRWMLSSKDISLEEHLKFIQNLADADDKYYFLVKNNDDYIGVIDFTSIKHIDKTAEIGLYAKPYLRGVGSILMHSLLCYGFDVLKCKKLYVTAYLENEKAISLYKKYNFTQYAEDNKFVYMELSYENR